MAVNSPVRTGCFQLVGTKLWAARLYTSSGLHAAITSMSESWSSRSAWWRWMLPVRWLIRSNVSVLARRTIPWTSYPFSSSSSAR
jgi:hypothetical protein